MQAVYEEEKTAEPEVIDCTDGTNVPVTNLLVNNEEWKEEHKRKCEVFNKWCHDNGV